MVCTYWQYVMALEELSDVEETPELGTPEARRMQQLERLVEAYEAGDDEWGEGPG